MPSIENIRHRAERDGYEILFTDERQAAIDGILLCATKRINGGFVDLAVYDSPSGPTVKYTRSPSKSTIHAISAKHPISLAASIVATDACRSTATSGGPHHA